MRVIGIDNDDDARRWGAYVSSRATTVTDLPEWRAVLRDTYGMRSHPLAALQGDAVVGTLSLFEVAHPLFGRFLATAPFGNAGGLHFDGEDARDALLREATALADRLGVDYLVIRTEGIDLAGFQVDRSYRTAILNLEGGVDAVWSTRLSSSARNQVRRGTKEGFTVASGPGEATAFQDVFTRHMRALGSPAPGPRFYESVALNLGERAEFFVVREADDLVGGALVFWVGDSAMDYHAVALHDYSTRCPNYLLYWTMIESACRRGCKRFDMGRSLADSSTLAFKQRWGPDVLTLCYNYHLVRAKAVPFVDPRNPKYRLAVAAWRRMPLVMTRMLGPRLIGGLA